MATGTLGGSKLTDAEARVASLGLADNQTILDKLTNVLARVGIADFIGFIGIEPNLSLTALEDGSGESFLGCEVDPIKI